MTTPDTDPEWTAALIEQRIAELSEADFDALVARTRPPKLNPKQRATDAIREYRGYRH
jgi:hypothetical protein